MNYIWLVKGVLTVSVLSLGLQLAVTGALLGEDLEVWPGLRGGVWASWDFSSGVLLPRGLMQHRRVARQRNSSNIARITMPTIKGGSS